MIGLYARVSTQEQAAEGYSIGEQQDRLRAFAASFGWRDVKMYVDPGFSGANLNRPAMQELIRDVEAGKIARVVVFKLDRLSRSQKDTLHLIEDVFLPHGCDFVSMSEAFDTGTPFGRAMIGILSVFAQLERDTIKERMTIGKVARAKSGLYHGGSIIPPGYDYRDGLLVVNEEEAAQVRELFRLYLSGKSPRSLVEEFAARGYRIRGRVWSLGRVKSVLRNRVYVGKVKFDGQLYNGTHEPIVDPDLFEAVQDLLDGRAAAYKQENVRQAETEFLLCGLCYCRECGSQMRTMWGTQHWSGGNPSVRYKYYRCAVAKEKKISRSRGLSCDAHSVRADKLEAVVLDQIRKLALDPSAMESIRKNRKPEPDEKPVLRQQIARFDRQISRLLDLYASGDFDVDELTEKVSGLREARQIAQNRLFELETRKSSKNAKKARESLSGFSDAVERADCDQLKMIIRALIDRIDADRDEVVIHWKFE